MKQTARVIPEKILSAILGSMHESRAKAYLTGGFLRDALQGISPKDIDITVSNNAFNFGRHLASVLKASFVQLDTDEGICRVVYKGLDIDISEYRKKAASIREDLVHRDFTINALAIELSLQTDSQVNFDKIIDPLGGRADIDQGIIRVCSAEAFIEDPLRMLRAYRFRAQTGFEIDNDTAKLIGHHSEYISSVSGERVWEELKKIFQYKKSSEIFDQMNNRGLLQQLFPELTAGAGIKQPSSHHLDVLGHSLETLKQIESVMSDPQKWFNDFPSEVVTYCAKPDNCLCLKVAAMLHDIGKPVTHAVKPSGRITFYNHDGHGEKLVSGIAKRLKWSTVQKKKVMQFVKQHMWPFHLNNARKKTGITPRACLKLSKAAGDDLVGLFVLAMADCLAGQGVGKPDAMEHEISKLFGEIYSTFISRVEPVLKSLPINGHDLINDLKLSPGPYFGKIFSELEKEIVSAGPMTRQQAIDWVRKILKEDDPETL